MPQIIRTPVRIMQLATPFSTAGEGSLRSFLLADMRAGNHASEHAIMADHGEGLEPKLLASKLPGASTNRQ